LGLAGCNLTNLIKPSFAIPQLAGPRRHRHTSRFQGQLSIGRLGEGRAQVDPEWMGLGLCGLTDLWPNQVDNWGEQVGNSNTWH
jgi:hypothetical protein